MYLLSSFEIYLHVANLISSLPLPSPPPFWNPSYGINIIWFVNISVHFFFFFISAEFVNSLELTICHINQRELFWQFERFQTAVVWPTVALVWLGSWSCLKLTGNWWVELLALLSSALNSVPGWEVKRLPPGTEAAGKGAEWCLLGSKR